MRFAALIALLAWPAQADEDEVWVPERLRDTNPEPDYELELGFNLWRSTPAGTAEDEDDKNDLQDDLALASSTVFGFRGRFAHPVRWLPDLALSYDPLSTRGTQFLDEALTFEGVTFQAGQRVDSGMDMKLLDLALYWRPLRLKRLAQLRLGLVARNIRTRVFVRGRIYARESALEVNLPVVPMGYLGFSSQPIRWLSVELDARGIGFGESLWIDAEGRLRGWLGDNLYVGLGYRYQLLVVKGQGAADVDATLSGVEGELGLRF